MIDIPRTIKLVTGALFDSEATWRAYLPEARDWKRTIALLTVPVIVATMIVAYALGLVTGGASLLGLRPTLLSTLLAIVFGICAVGICAFIFSALARVFGGKHDFALGLAAVSLAFVPAYVGQALSSLPWIGWLLSLGLGIYGLVLLWRIIPLYLEVPAGKRAAHYIVSLIASIVVSFVISAVIGVGQITGDQDSPFGTISGAGSASTTAGGGLFGGLAQRAELVAAAQEDRYEPPSDGRLDGQQVREFARVMERYGEALREQEARLTELSERAEENERPSLGDIATLASSVGEVSGLSTAEIEIVKSAGGNWAEHQWVKQTLRTAWLQKDINDTVAHNYALYQEYEDQLRDFIARPIARGSMRARTLRAVLAGTSRMLPSSRVELRPGPCRRPGLQPTPRRLHSKLKTSSSSGRSIPASQYCSQIRAQGRPYMSGTSSSITEPGATGVAVPWIGKIVCTHSMKGCGSPCSNPLIFTTLRMMRTGSMSASGS
jgi:hypothetical protein